MNGKWRNARTGTPSYVPSDAPVPRPCRRPPSGGGGGSVIGGAAALLGLDGPVEEDELAHSDGLIGFTQLGRSVGREERRELGRLVRGGVPLAYRAKVWLESSGGLEMQEPGVFAELLAQADSDGGSVVREIDKDVGRTMPLNMFFGGDGVGVQKLRRVLIAYSRCVSPFSAFHRRTGDFGFLTRLLDELDGILRLGTVKV